MGQRRWMVLGAVALVILLLFSIGSSMRQSAWNEGYMIGRLSAAAGQDGGVAPVLPYGYAPGGWGGGSFLGGLGFLLTLGFFLFLFLGVGRFVMFRVWQRSGGPWMGPEGSEGSAGPGAWHGRHGRRPPWCGGYEEKAEAKSEAQSEAADAPAQ